METERVTITAEPPEPDAATPAEVAAIVHDAITEEHVRDTLEEIRDGDNEWQTTVQSEMNNLSQRVAAMEITLSGLAAGQAAIAEEVETVSEKMVERLVEDSTPEEIVLPPEPEPEPEPKQAVGFSPLRKIL